MCFGYVYYSAAVFLGPTQNNTRINLCWCIFLYTTLHEIRRYWQFRTSGVRVMVDWFYQRIYKNFFAHSLFFVFNNVWTEDQRQRCNSEDQMGNASESCLFQIQHPKQNAAHRIKNFSGAEGKVIIPI